MDRTKTAHMDRISVIDTVWFLGDSQLPGEPYLPAQMGVLGFFRGELPSFEDFLARFKAGFDRVPRMRHRVLRFPFDIFRPLWVDDADFDIHRHIQVADYEGTPTYDGLRSFLESLVHPPLDRAHPLWKIWLVPRIDEGRWGIVFVMHHAAADALGLLELQPTFMDSAPGGDAGAAPRNEGTDTPWLPSPTPSLSAQLLGALDRAMGLGKAVLGALADAVSDMRGALRRLASFGQQVSLISRQRPQTWKCQPISVLSGRRSGPPANGLVKFPVSELLAAKERIGASVTSVYLAGLAIGLARWLQRQGVDTSSLTLRVAVPIAFRSDASRELGNEVGGMWVSVPMWEMSSAQRVAAIADSISKQQDVAKAGWKVFRFVNLMPGFTMRAVMERTSRPDWFNFAASALRGPEEPYYMFGCQLEEVLSAGFLPPHNRLAIAMSSYNGAARCHVMSDRDAIPDHQQLVDDFAEGFAELLAECGADPQSVVQGAQALGLTVDDRAPEPGRQPNQQLVG